jgi:tetratricopeptide (TPR) repeat protein
MSDLLATAVELHQSGRFKEAEATYRRVLRQEPHNPEALHLLGLLAHQVGDNQAAARLIGRAIEVEGSRALYHFNLGVVMAACDDTAAAESTYRAALAVDPGHADAHNNLGLLLQDKREHGAALEAFRRAVQHDPKHAEAQVNLGRALQQRGQSADALACFETALALDRRLPEAHFERGRSLEQQDRWTDAEAAYRAALDARPAFPEAQNNLAAALLAQGRYDAAQEAFGDLRNILRGPEVRTAAEVLAAEATPQDGAGPAVATRFSLLDRAEQLEHLLRRQVIEPRFAEAASRLRKVAQAFEPKDGRDWRRSLSAQQAAQIGGALERVIHLSDAPRLAGAAVNPSLDFGAIERAFLGGQVPSVHFDDFLTPEALKGLRRFCRDSTVYFGADPAGFVSATMASGFNCSLMYQIAEELKAAMPEVLGPHHLSNMWSYRHRAEGGGVLAHTDLAAVTFNFWITPDEANRDPESGGLVVYVREQPLDWDWSQVNRQKSLPEVQARIEGFLEGAEEIVIPHRGNRAVMFHSNLFHKSDRFAFADAFEARRVNISLLFGHRGASGPGRADQPAADERTGR